MPNGNTSQLQIPLMAENDNQKYLLFNDAIQSLDDAINRLLSVDLSAGDVTLTESQLTRYGFFRLTGAAVVRTLTIPSTVGGPPPVDTNRAFLVENTGTADVTITHNNAGTDAVIPAGESAVIYGDGTDITKISGGGGGGASTLPVDDDGTNIVPNASRLNFTGPGVAVTDNSGTADISVPGVKSQDDGTDVVVGTDVLNFTGAGVTVSNPSGSVTEVNITGGGGGGHSISDEGTVVLAAPTDINFTGAGVTVTNDGDGTATVDIPGGGGTTPLLPFAKTTKISNATSWNSTGVTPPAGVSVDTDDAAGYIAIRIVGSTSGAQPIRYENPAKRPTAGTDFDHVLQISLAIPKYLYTIGGVFIEDSTTNKVVVMGQFSNGQMKRQYWNDTAYVNEAEVPGWLDENPGGWDSPHYWRVKRTGSSVDFMVSKTGIIWDTTWTYTIGDHAADVDRIGIFLNAQSMPADHRGHIACLGHDDNGPQTRLGA